MAGSAVALMYLRRHIAVRVGEPLLDGRTEGCCVRAAVKTPSS